MLVADERPLSSILGEGTAKTLGRQLAVKTVGELLEHFPRRYGHRGELTKIANLPIGELVTVLGEVTRCSERRAKGRSGSILEAVVTDGESNLTLTFFNQAWRIKDLQPGRSGLFSGKVGEYRGKLQLAHPDYEIFSSELDDKAADDWSRKPIPIYPATASLPSWRIQRAIAEVLGTNPPISEPLAEITDKHSQLSLTEAIFKVHQPERDSDWQAAQKSLKFHEAVLLQLGIALRRREYADQTTAVRRAGELLVRLDASLPFNPTVGQIEVGGQIADDMSSGHPMHRLLQGDVGSGKTLVALRAAMIAAESGGQVAVLAPTEILAEQHFNSMRKLLGDDLERELELRLLTASTDASARKQTLLRLASGSCRLVIGTHSLIQEKVQFYDLALAIIDEQHRFGVGQRDALRAKAKQVPHLLAMTATPIPRSLALTLFGDLELSYLRELPAGRAEIKTHLVPAQDSRLLARVWQRVAEEIAAGNQVFVVCPRIEDESAEPDMPEQTEETDSSDRKPATAIDVAAGLSQNPLLSQARVGLVHGRLNALERTEQMRLFAAAELDVLVATTVIEVGVDIPNATTMVILDADRFGLAQLHQLRGRVGRGNKSGLCLLVSHATEGPSIQRLEAMVQSADGFTLSELDLEQRGEGDVVGEMQSGGRSRLKLLRVVRDALIIEEAKKVASELVIQPLPAELKRAIDPELSAAIQRG